MAAIKISDHQESELTTNIMNSIKAKIASLTPRGLYGLTQYVKGLEVVREEAPDLIGMILNYQLGHLRMNQEVLEEIAQGAQSRVAEDTPMDTGNEETYRIQLAELNTMGFINKDENLNGINFY